jgi:putative transposase
MAKLPRPSDPKQALAGPRTFFVTTQTAGRRSLFQTDRMAKLLIDVFRSQMRERGIMIHDFVVMPDHIHILMTLPAETTIEKAMQLIKGRFSFRAKRELGFGGEIWQRGFSDVYATDSENFNRHQEYIWKNPVKRGLASAPKEYPYGSLFLKAQKAIRKADGDHVSEVKAHEAGAG